MSEPGTPDASSFNLRLRRQTIPAACADMFREAIAPFGFDTFACGEVDLAHRDRSVFYLIDWPDEWRRIYMSGLLDHDPVVRFLPLRTEPYTWSDLRADPAFTRADRLMLDKVAAFGWHDGLVVPVSRAEGKIGLVSLAGRKSGVSPEAIAYLCLISVCLHSHVRSLLATQGFAAPPVGLTPRELACLKLVARGKSDAAIADALSIAVSTAHEHVENAKRKLKTGSRTKAVAVAISLGIIEA